MDVVIDPSIELLGAVDLLGTRATAALKGPGRDYARALAKACAPFKTHPAVKLNARMHKSDPDFFQRKDLLLMRTAPPELEFDAALDSCRGEAERSGVWEPWLGAMRAFARDSRFTAVLGACAPRLSPAVDALRRRVEQDDHAGKIERYTGLPFLGRYRIIVSPLCARGVSLNRVWLRDDARHEIVSILDADSCPSAERDSADHSLDAVVWHELGHGVLDMTANLYDHEEKDRPFSLGAGLRSNCRNWLHGMREHLVRAVMLRLVALERGEEAASREFRLEEFSRRPHLAAFLSRLREYEASRERYPALSDFYPRLLEVFPRQSAKLEPPADPGRESWPDALRKLAGPYYTERQRARAVAHLDALLERSRDERLILRRAALNFLLGEHARAAEDASALLSRHPADVAALIRWGAGLTAKARARNTRP
ncbi:MAG: DUF4932 domain-containing protein [Elusimicrobia bacterium]|nr:DUF4932 domain-containing protein [Elusimicrobiota bacterium]